MLKKYLPFKSTGQFFRDTLWLLQNSGEKEGGERKNNKNYSAKKAKVVRDSNEHLLGGAYFRVEKKL